MALMFGGEYPAYSWLLAAEIWLVSLLVASRQSSFRIQTPNEATISMQYKE